MKKKLIALIKTADKTKAQILAEVKKLLGNKNMLNQKEQINVEPNKEHKDAPTPDGEMQVIFFKKPPKPKDNDHA